MLTTAEIKNNIFFPSFLFFVRWFIVSEKSPERFELFNGTGCPGTGKGSADPYFLMWKSPNNFSSPALFAFSASNIVIKFPFFVIRFTLTRI